MGHFRKSDFVIIAFQFVLWTILATIIYINFGVAPVVTFATGLLLGGLHITSVMINPRGKS